MALFDPKNRNRSPRHARIYAAYEIAFTCVDFAAAFFFIIGSVLFFYPELENPAIWFFVVGSVCFALKPTIRLAREIQYLQMGDVEDIARKFDP